MNIFKVPHSMASRCLGVLGINLFKDIYKLNTETYKALLRKIKTGIKKCIHKPYP